MTQTVSIDEAKKRLQDLLALASEGNEVIITDEGKPLARLAPIASKVVVDEVTDPATELSIEEAREMAGDDVEIGDALLFPLPMEELGRIAAQTARGNKKRTAGLNRGKIWTSNDFDEPLPDEFWNGQE